MGAGTQFPHPGLTEVLSADRNGNPDSAYHFDGLSSRIDIPSSPSLASPDTALTIAAWIRRDSWGMVGSQYNPILTKSTDLANAFQYRLVTSTNGLGTALNSWNTSHNVTLDFLQDVWYQVAITWESGTLHSYINGALVNTGYLAVTIVPDNRTLSIGSDVPGILEIFFGDIDEVQIYNRAIAAQDVAELAGAVSAVPLAFPTRGGIELGHAFPNPVFIAAALPFSLADEAVVNLEIIDVAGRRVVGGIYLYRVSTANGAATGKLVINH